jgi:hypothetical protein|eukprot:COSAG06_NODE_567_length_14186_cov_3.587918_2_plen_154_part_00
MSYSPDIIGFLRVIALSFVLLWTTCAYIVRVVPHHRSRSAARSLALRRWQAGRFKWINRGVACMALVLLWAALEPQIQDTGNILGLFGLAAVVVYASSTGQGGLAQAVGSGDDDALVAQSNNNKVPRQAEAGAMRVEEGVEGLDSDNDGTPLS